MTISRERFSLALEKLRPSDWEHFEELASTFLASEFGTLRTLASPGGDGGRDAILWCSEGDPTTVLQYSVTDKWKPKIRETQNRLKETAPEARELIYVSNQVIGASADELRREFRKAGLSLDIRDRSYFLERVHEDTARTTAALSLARRIVDPLLEDRRVLTTPGVLKQQEASTALLFIEMQRQDEVVEKGLTKSCFDALVKAALNNTTPESRIGREEVYRRVSSYLPNHAKTVLIPFVDAALKRLKRHSVSHWQERDEFNLNHSETEHIKDAAARLIRFREAFDNDLADIVNGMTSVSVKDSPALIETIHKIIEIYFLRRGEEFANSVHLGKAPPVNEDDLKEIIREHFKPKLIHGRDAFSVGFNIVTTLLATPSDLTKSYLGLLSDSYTLMSFLSATPDVQAATKKLFSHGKIWLDAGVVLPVLAETMRPEVERPFTAMFRQARSCGINLFITWGVIEEVERHLNRCRAYSLSSSWEGSVPFVYARYIFAGGDKHAFRSWLENFVGPTDPIQDLADYLADEFGVSISEHGDASSIPQEYQDELRNYWQSVHEDRRGNDGQEYNINIDRLARHDVENCLIVCSERLRDRKSSAIAQQSWWLTLDRAATHVPRINDRTFGAATDNLVISLDFLMRYIAFGPNRERALRDDASSARIFSQPLMEVVPQELVKTAIKIREQSASMPERLIRRRLRDALSIERANLGPLHEGGIDGANDILRAAY